jgi:cbb3-type cytochrome oxidase subunit 3
MKLSDLVSNLGLSIFPIVGLILFLAVFIGVVIRATSRRRAADLDHAARLPLDDGPVLASANPSHASAREVRP